MRMEKLFKSEQHGHTGDVMNVLGYLKSNFYILLRFFSIYDFSRSLIPYQTSKMTCNGQRTIQKSQSQGFS